MNAGGITVPLFTTYSEKDYEYILNDCSPSLVIVSNDILSYKEKSKVYRISDLINKLESYSELKRIRYTTSHPKDMTDDLIQCYSTSKKLMPFVHLPIQSGSNKILKLMNRKHTVEKYIEIYETLLKILEKAPSGKIKIVFSILFGLLN